MRDARLSGYQIALAAVLTVANTLHAQIRPEWTELFPPFRIAGNLYYVGSKDLASYLITTRRGHILINSDLVGSVPLIRASVAKLGFSFGDIRILLISHAHWDHDGGSAEIKRLTGATYMVMDADVPVVESGGKADFQYGNEPTSLYPPSKVHRVLHDGDKVKLGDMILVAHLTPGHTKGCTSVDIFLGPHASYFNLEAKYASLKAGPVKPFIDPVGYKNFVSDREQVFRAELAEQRASLHTGTLR